MADGTPFMGKVILVLGRNPNRMDSKNAIHVRIKNITLTVDDGVIIRMFTRKCMSDP